MPRQNFLSRDFFVNVSEFEIRERLLCIPDMVSNIRFLGENKNVPSVRFLYEQMNNDLNNIDVHVLPLNEQYTKITMHISYTDGHSFYHDPVLMKALANFENAVNAVLYGHSFTPCEERTGMQARLKSMRQAVASSINMFFTGKSIRKPA